jgi:hypothetical protein
MIPKDIDNILGGDFIQNQMNIVFVSEQNIAQKKKITILWNNL